MTIFSDEYFMQIAINQAKEAKEKGEIPVGAIVVANNQIIAKSHNLTELLHDVTAHAEIQAISAAANYLNAKYLKNCTLYVTLEPCQMCAGALYWSQISHIVCGAEDSKRGYRAFGCKLHPKTTIKYGVLEEECRNLMIEFFTKKRT
ncbi:nucleoside deaminase [Myroides pelagicus]|uniref:nucleoside deaminase n=1 Tax=Myroides pelagicus TaxID=270914 RepID=UPI002DB7037C|nr:nucleoside deaminase [Myroides pelagicus]MEC4112812.1 nucleoside deaminase [Myroides pelagicus]